jgi:hypothetical protein
MDEQQPTGGETILAGAAPRLVPLCAGSFDGLTPTVIEAFDGHVILPSASRFKFGLRGRRGIRCSLHLLQQISIGAAFRCVFREWPYDNAELGQVWSANFRRSRF